MEYIALICTLIGALVLIATFRAVNELENKVSELRTSFFERDTTLLDIEYKLDNSIKDAISEIEDKLNLLQNYAAMQLRKKSNGKTIVVSHGDLVVYMELLRLVGDGYSFETIDNLIKIGAVKYAQDDKYMLLPCFYDYGLAEELYLQSTLDETGE